MLAAKLPLIVHSSILLSLIALLLGVAIGAIFLLISLGRHQWEQDADPDQVESAIKTS